MSHYANYLPKVSGVTWWSFVAFLLCLSFSPQLAFAEDPTHKVQLILDSGEIVEGKLLSKDHKEYRVLVAGSKITVSHFLVKEATLCPLEAQTEEKCFSVKIDKTGLEPPPAPGGPKTPPVRHLRAESPPLPPSTLPYARSQELSIDPPKPRGGALTTAGWVTFAAGGSFTVVTGLLYALFEDLGSGNPQSTGINNGMFPFVVATGAATAAGLSMAIVGAIQRHNYNTELQQWKLQQSGRLVQQEPSLSVAPILGKEVKGLGLSMTF